MPEEVSKLISKAIKTLKNSYAPYSGFPVSALLLTKSKKIYCGVNIENSSLSLTICAERVALFKALSEGEKKFKMLLIYTPTKRFTFPCGACRQVLKEFTKDIKIILVNREKKKKIIKLSALLPSPFTAYKKSV